MYSSLTLQELQRLAQIDELAAAELGRRVTLMPLCEVMEYLGYGDCWRCEELIKENDDLQGEMPPDEYEQIFDAGAEAVLEWPIWEILKAKFWNR